MDTISGVHAQAHISTLGRLQLSTFSDLKILFATVLMINLLKIVARFSIPFRDKVVTRFMNFCSTSKKTTSEESFTAPIADRNNEDIRFIATVLMYTEMFIENSSFIIAAVTIFQFQKHRSSFMFPFPNFELDWGTVMFVILIQWSLAIVSDMITIYFAPRVKLPSVVVWKKIWEAKFPFLGFLIYGTLTMGVLGAVYMTAKIPRVWNI
jgi:hypothetical protein